MSRKRENNSIVQVSAEQSLYPLLQAIDSPADLKKLPVEELPALCAELRSFLINHVSRNPGHFGSSMGAVELTVALHYVFDTPHDLLVWDVGHQAYAHKILTGRRDLFHTNRTKGGLSGFPSPQESPYDTFAAGHASNSISAALGMAVATELNGDKPRRRVAAIIGDASISGGLAFEALNNAANSDSNVLIILNDNNMSIDRNVGSLHSYLAHINTSRGYNNMRLKLYNLMRRMHLVSDRHRGPIMRFNNSLKSLLSNEQNIFEGLNIRYMGPLDGHDVVKLVKVLNDIKDMKGPRLLHLRTVKGKGYAPAEADPASWHAPGKFDPGTGKSLVTEQSGGKKMKWQDVFGHALLELARSDSRVVGVTAAMSSGTSVNIMQAELPRRTFDVGISEGHALTFAGGMAIKGLRPFVAIYSSFLQRAYDNIVNDNALTSLPVTMCIDRAGLVGADGATHHGTLDLAYLNPVPGVIISAPGDADTLRDLMYTSLHTDHGPWAIRYPRGEVKVDEPFASMKEIAIGKSRVVKDGCDAVVLSLGAMLGNVLKAAGELENEGIEAQVVDMIFLKPIDEEMLRSVGESGLPVITVEDGTTIGGLGTTVVSWLSSHGYGNKVKTLGIPDRFIKHATVAQQQQECGLDSESIATAVRELVGKFNSLKS